MTEIIETVDLEALHAELRKARARYRGRLMANPNASDLAELAQAIADLERARLELIDDEGTI